MKINEHEAVLAPRVLLVPYCSHHVPTYHEWMQDEEIQKATASEPLTLPQEHSMQQSWRLDHDKLTFIVCLAPSTPSLNHITPQTDDAPSKMIGDVNLFIREDDPDKPFENALHGAHDIGGTTPGETTRRRDGRRPKAVRGELEIMIADTSARGKGLGRETLLAFMWYITHRLPSMLEEYRLGSECECQRYLKSFDVKIGKENVGSLKLFESVGFGMTMAEPNFFGEVSMGTGLVEGRAVDVEKKVGEGWEDVGRVVKYGV